MADSIRNRNARRRAAMGLSALLSLAFSTAGSGAATPPVLDAGFTWSADVLNSDFRNDTLDISGNVRVTQGASSIEAQTAKARNVRAETQRWTFEDAVRMNERDTRSIR